MRKDTLLQHIRKLVSETLEIPEPEVDVNAHLQDIGFTSVLLVNLVDKISEALNEDIHPGLFLEHTSIYAFSNYLLEQKPEWVNRYLGDKASDNILANNDESLPDFEKMAYEQQMRETEDNQGWQNAEKLFFGQDKTTDKTASKHQPASQSQTNARSLPDNVPVLIGGGISAMLISHRLSEQNIDHLVIGPPQLGDSPKLGESMTEAVTIEFTRKFKQHAKYFHPKNTTPFYMGDIVAGLRFDFFGSLVKLFSDDEVPQTFIHVDRIGFDEALYHEVIQNKECHWIDDLVSDIEYSRTEDKITKIVLKSGRAITPTFAWDCTNHVRLLGRKLNISYVEMDPQRQVIFTHYLSKESLSKERLPKASCVQDGVTPCQENDLPWMHATSLLRADKKVDQLEGVSWLIPLGDYVSVGISMDPKDIGDRNPEEIITALTKAYQRRGLDYSKHFPRRKEIVSVPSQHFMYDRYVGTNWALVGGSAANAWFPSGSNISQVVCMACMADKIIGSPKIYGEHYTRHVKGFARTHEIYNTLLKSNLGPLDAIKFLSGIVEQGRRRISSFFMFRNGLDSEVARVASELWREDVPVDKRYFEYLRQIATHAQPETWAEQTDTIFENLAKLKENKSDVTLPYLRNSTIEKEKAELFVA
jgi:acyl carrier protein